MEHKLHDGEEIKISFVNYTFYKRDATCLIMHDQVRALTEAPGRRYDIRIFVVETNFDDPRINMVRGPADILRSGHFRESKVLIFQWGFLMDLFDIVFTTLPHQRTLTYFHNVTPSRLFNDPKQKYPILLSEKQIDNLFFSDFIFCNSVFSMNDLIDRGIPRERIEVLNPVPFNRTQPNALRPECRAARLLYVGRFVRHKGVRELLLAVAEARRAGAAPFHLRMVGALRHSDKAYINELMSIIATEGLEDTVTFLGELSDGALGLEFAQAHALVMPSYHEGFCVPVVDALRAGCYVIAFDGGNLPYLVGDLGTVLAAGDISALSAALVDFADRVAQPMAKRYYRTASGELPVKAYEDEAMRYASRYTSYEAFREKFVAGVERLLGASEAHAAVAISSVAPNVDNGIAGNGAAQTLDDRLTKLEKSFVDRRRTMLAAQNVIEMQRLGSQWRAALFDQWYRQAKVEGNVRRLFAESGDREAEPRDC